MKKRIQIDSSLLAGIIILTFFVCRFPGLYGTNRWTDNLLDVLGVWLIMTGVFVRMVARGHKKAHSQKGGALVTDGPYALSRNPMYLGSFLIGAGFVLVVWPWWILPIFAAVFYGRFQRQVRKEEALLKEMFGRQYTNYCRRVPRVFPRWKRLARLRLRRVMRMEEAFDTKERRGLIGWPLLAVVLESVQEKMVFGETHLGQTLGLFLLAMILFGFGVRAAYRRRGR